MINNTLTSNKRLDAKGGFVRNLFVYTDSSVKSQPVGGAPTRDTANVGSGNVCDDNFFFAWCYVKPSGFLWKRNFFLSVRV